jgi:hypothetical protein
MEIVHLGTGLDALDHSSDVIHHCDHFAFLFGLSFASFVNLGSDFIEISCFRALLCHVLEELFCGD